MTHQMRFPEFPSAIAAVSSASAPSSDAQNSARGESLRISCSDCRMVNTAVCDDCIVTHLLGRLQGSSAAVATVASGLVRRSAPVVVIDGNELATLHLLQEAGMAPRNRHVSRHPSARSTGLLAAI